MIAFALAVLVSTTQPQGAVDANCTKEDVCQDGFTATVRPPAAYTNALKKLQLQQHSLAGDASSFEEDHFVPLELCGCATCSMNLWPQPWPEARKKDVDETRLHRAVCKGQISLEDAQKEIRAKWKIHD